MQKSEDIDKLRSNYEELRRKILTGDASSIKREDIVNEKKLLMKETNHAQ